MNITLIKDDRDFLLELVKRANYQAWSDLEECKTHWEEVYYYDIIETCERIEKGLMKK